MNKFILPFSALLVIYVIAIVAYHNLEGWNYIDSIYFATTTLTTLGSGQLYPTTPISKLFTVVYIWLGVGVGFYTLYSLTDYYRDVVSKKAESIIDRSKKIINDIEHKK